MAESEEQSKKAEEKGKPSPQKTQTQKKKEPTTIVRIAGKDLRGDLPLPRAISSIRGIGLQLADIISNSLSRELSIDISKPIGALSEEQIKTIEEKLQDLPSLKIPSYLYNRQKDRASGKDMHLIGNELAFATKQDINYQIDLYTWVGYRHFYGQKVRGQRTRTTGRSGMTVGVIRKSAIAKGAAAPESKQTPQPSQAQPSPSKKEQEPKEKK
ncbi:MAG: 30S ribosomal protein S13 [Candidatus Anstonellales archaeon]